MGELVAPEAHDHLRPAGHCRMDRVVPEEETDGRVPGIRRPAADRVAGIKIPQVGLHALFTKESADPIPEKANDITEPDFPRRSTYPGL